MKSIVLLLIFISLIFGLTSMRANNSPLDWPMFMHDPQHTGFSESKLLIPLNKNWEFTVGRIYSSPIIVDDKIFIVGGGMIYCLNINNGMEIWRNEIGETYSISSTPAVVNNRIYVGTGEAGDIVSYNVYSGKVIWKQKVGGYIETSPVIINETGYIGTGTCCVTDIPPEMNPLLSRIIAFDIYTGKVRWEFQTDSWIFFSPAAGNNRIFVGSANRMYALNTKNGKEIWRFESNGDVESSPAISNGKIFFRSVKGFLYSIDEATGKKNWEFKYEGDGDASPALAYGKVFLTSYDFDLKNGKVYALNENNGEKIWQVNTNEGILRSPIVADDKVIVATYNGRIIILEVLTGIKLDEIKVEGAKFTSISIANGMIFIGSEEGKLYAYGQRQIKEKEDQKEKNFELKGFLFILILLLLYKHKIIK